jgi:hypothetical protein
MNALMPYLLNAVFVPALVAGVFALIVAVGPLRRKPALLEAGLASAFCLAFTLSFAREVDAWGLVRNFFAIEGESAPIERWHRIGLAALLLMGASALIAFARFAAGQWWARAITIASALIVSIFVGVFVVFPGATMWTQLAQAALVLACIATVSTCTRIAVLWIACLVFACLAPLAVLGGFASLAVMCAATCSGALIIATVVSAGARWTRDAAPLDSVGALAVAIGTMIALVTSCGIAYDTAAIPLWAWLTAAMIPLGGCAFLSRANAASTRTRATLWVVLGSTVLALALLGAMLLRETATPPAREPTSGDPMDGIFGRAE